MSYFPMFIELNGRRCLVVGGGGTALHKIRVLKEFGADVLVWRLYTSPSPRD